MKHAPAPWKYRPDKYSDWGEVRGADGYIVTRVSVCRHTEDQLSEHRKSGTDPEEYTARLIAAAPDMYEALANIENDDNHMPDTAWHLIQSALKKARGEHN